MWPNPEKTISNFKELSEISYWIISNKYVI